MSLFRSFRSSIVEFFIGLALVGLPIGAQASDPAPSPSQAPSAPTLQPDTYPSHENGRPESMRSAQAQEAAPDWKGSSPPNQGSLSVMGGVAILDDYRPGFSLIGAASKKIVDRGFVPDLNDSVSVEAELGPVFALGSVAFFYSAHLKWDFILNPSWSFYALGGLAGSAQGDAFGNHFVLLPRFGAGAEYRVADGIGIRWEISHELIVLGATFPF